MSNILLTTFYVLFAFLAWRRLPLAVLLVIATLPSYLIRFHLGPVPMTALEGMILILVVVWTTRKFPISPPKAGPPREDNSQFPMKIQMQKLKIPLLLLLLSATVAMFIAPDLRAAAGIWKAYFLEAILFFVVIMDLLHNPSPGLRPPSPRGRGEGEGQRGGRGSYESRFSLEQVVAALSVTALLLSLYAIFQRFTGFGIPSPWDKELRVTSIFPYPNALGLFLAPLVPLFVAATFRSPSWRSKDRRYLLSTTYYLLVTLSSIVAIIFAKSTGAIVGVSAGLFVMIVFYLSSRGLRPRSEDVAISTTRKRLPRSLRSLAMTVIGGLILIAILVSIPRVHNELLLRDWSGHVRRTQWSETIEMLKDTSTALGAGRPIFGAGLAGYKEALVPYHQAKYLEIFEYPHNLVLNFWSEIGLLGVFAFAWLVIIFFRTTIPSLKIREGREGYEPLAFAAAMTTLLIHGLVDVPYFKNDLAILFWIFFALGLTNSEKSEMMRS